MMTFKELIALQFPFFEDRYEQNLEKLVSLIKVAPKESVVVAPELVLTNFSFSKMKESANFSKLALDKLLDLSKDKIIALTMTEEIDGKFYNSAKILYKKRVIHSQPKVKLFKFGDEDNYFSAGSREDIKIVEIDGLKYAILICFEIRFTQLWEQIRGADIVLIPALWGINRKAQLEAITKALAIINQAFVVVSDSSNQNMASSSGVITPFGEEFRDDSREFINYKADLREIKKMRRYMDVGIL